MKNMLCIILLVVVLSSCEKVFLSEELESTDPMTNFEYFWQQINEEYAYFSQKGVDWEQTKVEYDHKIYQGMKEDSLFEVLADMLGELNDGHNNLFSDFNVSRSYVTFTGNDNYDRRIIYDHYTLGNEHTTNGFVHSFLSNKEIGYIRYPAFVGDKTADALDIILERFKNTKGLILDIRENGGGVATDVIEILSRFIDSKELIYYTRFKIPSGDHELFSDIEPVHVKPSDAIQYQKKLVVLIDRGTYSAGSFLALGTKALDDVILIGDKTGGGLGVPNGGQLPNGWGYRCSSSQTLNLDKSPEWEAGVPPDIFIEFDWNNRTKDEILDRAIQEIQE